MKALPATALGRNNADYKRSYYHVSVDPEVSISDLLRPGFWVHYAQMLQVNDLVDVVSDVIDVQLRVVGKGVGLVNMRPRFIWAKDGVTASEAEAPAEPLPDMPEGYEVKRGPRGRWRVMQKDPLLEIASNIIDERDAILAARSHYQNANAIAA